jgi:hypothetical protein
VVGCFFAGPGRWGKRERESVCVCVCADTVGRVAWLMTMVMWMQASVRAKVEEATKTEGG